MDTNKKISEMISLAPTTDPFTAIGYLLTVCDLLNKQSAELSERISRLENGAIETGKR